MLTLFPFWYFSLSVFIEIDVSFSTIDSSVGFSFTSVVVISDSLCSVSKVNGKIDSKLLKFPSTILTPTWDWGITFSTSIENVMNNSFSFTSRYPVNSWYGFILSLIDIVGSFQFNTPS